ncbi:hypothetical protein K505DRAFT_392048 [Melanomma pulvis-pyrius CBS 109.77]|uniref:Uncharacterized protein n=1 Tax=Melanomma pulvis-pyrius CBS 109.77 TaxID=1314802 RepID=A0A6A6XQK5_9PLEO|nr:hypothetical protein K505DRAFT_392048 [Melanomma pulvis-pyrius CBS 109.77]
MSLPHETISEVYQSIKASLKTIENLSRLVPIYNEPTSLLSQFQAQMDSLQDLPSSKFPKLNLLDKPPSRIEKVFKKRPCKLFVLETGAKHAHEKIFTVLRDHMHDSVDAPLKGIIVYLQKRAEIRDTRNPRFEIPLGHMDKIGNKMHSMILAFNTSTSGCAWMLTQELEAMLEDLKHYKCVGEFDEERVEIARRQVKTAEYAGLKIWQVVEAMRKADRV